MKKMSDVAVNQCVAELRAACRLPIDPPALDTVVGWLRPNFERILDCREGRERWAAFGDRMRDNARHLGAFADFFGRHVHSEHVGLNELRPAFQIVRAACTIRATSGPDPAEDCFEDGTPVPPRSAEELLGVIAPALDSVRRVG